jgi:hypothetical protein
MYGRHASISAAAPSAMSVPITVKRVDAYPTPESNRNDSLAAIVVSETRR